MLRRNIDLSLMPTSKQLMNKVQEEMVPPNMKSTEIGASFPLEDALHHHGEHFLQAKNFLPFFRFLLQVIRRGKIRKGKEI